MTTPAADAALSGDVDRLLGRLVEPALVDLAAQLRSVGAVTAAERSVISAGVAAALRQVAWRRVSRVAVLELNAARLSGTLRAPDPAGRWREWIDRLAQPGGWEAVAAPYPPMLPRLRRIIDNRCAAGLQLAQRFGQDRADLAALLGSPPGQLREVRFGVGDSHQAGQTVTILRCDAGQLVYKPRSVRVDAVLGRFLQWLLPDEPAGTRIRVPAVLARTDRPGEYGWAAFVAHRYCDGEPELRAFYRGLGHWLAVMRLLGGSDLHNENVVACGPVPVVVDCETLFTPHAAARPSGYGAAIDLAMHRISQSLLRTGLLPGRGATLGWRGVDLSGAGFLPGQQPTLQVPVLVDHGTDRARIATAAQPVPVGENLPSPEPDLGRHWERVVAGFTEVTDRLRARDRAGVLAPQLAGFADCPVRVVLRDTVAYTELSRMLWHPGSLHQPERARERAAGALRRHAANQPWAPSDPAVVGAEVAELIDGDVPVFLTTPACGTLAGPRGTRWGEARDLVAETLDQWRRTDPATDRRVVQAALVGAYLNDGWRAGQDRLVIARPRRAELERRRRAQAAGIVRRVSEAAIRATDGTVTWIAPVLGPPGWSVQHSPAELYGGAVGVAVLLAAYLREVAHGRADEVPGLAELLDSVVRTLRRADDQQAADRAEAAAAGFPLRPDPPGGYLGLGSRIWGWLLLQGQAGVTATEAVGRAEALAGMVPEAVQADPTHDLLAGAAGAVVPLLRLAEHAAAAGGAGPDRSAPPERWCAVAAEIGHRLRERAAWTGVGAGWPSELFPGGIGGLSHGATGIGWALARLAAATGAGEFRELADAAFAREESLFDPQRRAWRDARTPVARAEYGAAWCHGSVGIGIAAADLLARDGDDRWREVLQRAVEATWREGFGWNHTLCHGDLGAWELLHRGWAAGLGPPGVDRDTVAARILTSLEAHGPVSGMAREVFAPGLLAGQGGMAYQLLRMHPDSDLPSMLLPDPGPPPAREPAREPR